MNKNELRNTPEWIRELSEDEVFVFGSNLGGFHGAGAAALAEAKFGAVWGKGVGHYGQSYAIPTMHGAVSAITPYVNDFIDYATSKPELTFFVTKIGCGIAGFEISEIAPLFQRAKDIENIYLPTEFRELF